MQKRKERATIDPYVNISNEEIKMDFEIPEHLKKDNINDITIIIQISFLT